MRYCIDLCQYKETTICCADCDIEDCGQRCEGVEYGDKDVVCKCLQEVKDE